MTIDTTGLVLRDNPAANRFEAEIGEFVAFADYVRDGNIITFTHTEVPEQFRGQGVAAKLVGFALDQAQTESLQIVPDCSYVADFIAKHPTYQSLLA